MTASAAASAVKPGSAREVFLAFLRLGLTSFGGPIAHLGYFHDEFVVRRRWLDEKTYADLVALCQFLPVRPVVRSALPSDCHARVILARSWPGLLSPRHRRSRSSCLPMAS